MLETLIKIQMISLSNATDVLQNKVRKSRQGTDETRMTIY